MAPTTLVDLPLELFRAILAECICARSIKRAFRLRLVNRQFAAEVLQVFHEYRILDDSPIPLEKTGNFGIEYMTRRLLNPKLPVSSQWTAIRRIAARLAAEDGNDAAGYEHYIKILTTRTVQHWAPSTMAAVCHDDYTDDAYSEAQEEYDLMAAAAYTNKLSLIEELIDNPANMGLTIGTFGNPFIAAVAGGHAAALDMLLENLRGRAVIFTRRTILANVTLHGSPSLVEKCVPEWPAKQLAYSNVQQDLHAALATPNVENFNIVMRVIEKSPHPRLTADQLAKALDRACYRGWEDMARHLVTLGAFVRKHYSSWTRDYWPLKSACHARNPAILQLLFDHGAQVEGDEIEEAARRGCWDAVWILIAHGADVSQAIGCAVAFERKDILLELVERGAVLTGEVGAQALEMAKKEGLESMVGFLEEVGAGSKTGEIGETDALLDMAL
ncbi:ankyrin [Lentithecium fluviatile CBS 122367]|uniref:Ankyrin n=1 Tax=Lentithecium fluviatile CBS 122367 TaxID=1168545 RepID=A0A6G1IV31_9PLEO|nr:ankyrin [Lentithecium fluviatile CBS 122367]